MRLYVYVVHGIPIRQQDFSEMPFLRFSDAFKSKVRYLTLGTPSYLSLDPYYLWTFSFSSGLFVRYLYYIIFSSY